MAPKDYENEQIVGRFQIGALKPERLQEELVAISRRLISGDDEELSRYAAAAEIDIASLTLPAQPEDVVHVETETAGLSPEAVAVIVAFAPVLGAIAKRLFDEVVIPALQLRFGLDVIGARLPDDD